MPLQEAFINNSVIKSALFLAPPSHFSTFGATVTKLKNAMITSSEHALNRTKQEFWGLDRFQQVQTCTMKQMGRSMIHFEKLQESSIIALPQLLAGLANKVVKTLFLGFSSSSSSSSSSALQPTYLTTAAPAAKRSFSSLALAAQTRKWYTHCAGGEGTDPGSKAAETCVSSRRQRAKTVQWPLMLK